MIQDRFPLYYVGVYLYLNRKMFLGIDPLYQTFHCHLCHVQIGDVDGGKGWINVIAQGHIVEAYNTDVRRNAVAIFLECLDGAGSNQVIIGKIAGSRFFPSL